MNMIDAWRLQISAVADILNWRNDSKQAKEKNAISNILGISPFIGGCLYNSSGELLGWDGIKDHDDCVFVGEFTLPLSVSINVLTTSYSYTNKVKNVTKKAGLKNRELNIRSVLSTIKKAEAGYVGKYALDYNAWNRGRTFTDKKYKDCPEDYRCHPGLLKLSENDEGRSAAGAYQFLEKYYKEIDFSPQSQDKGAIKLMKEHGVFDLAARGDVALFQTKASNIWTSFKAQKWQNHELEKVFKVYRSNELSGLSDIETPIGKLLEI